MIGLLFVDSMVRPSIANVETYHARVRATINAFPFQIGEWAGVDVPQPTAAVTLLKPNALISRRYHSRYSRYDVVLLIVQCRDARDMVGHYPPICYPSNGWTKMNSTPRDWDVEDVRITGMVYDFSRHSTRSPAATTIANFMILPSGKIAREIDEVNRVAQNYLRQSLGAAQVQILCDADMPDEEREEAIRLFLNACCPLINVMRVEDKTSDQTAGNSAKDR